MHVCVYGAGAIGGHMAMRLHEAGAEVSILARGATLEAIATNGLEMASGERHFHARLACAAEPEDLPAPDVVVVAVKSQGLAATAGRLARLARRGAPIVFAVNGLPWWYRRTLRRHFDAPPPRAGSDEAALAPILAADRVVGCTVGSTNSVERPGVIVNEMPSPNRYVFGAVDGALEPLCRDLAALMTAGGATGIATADITGEIWRKLQVNFVTNAFGCLTGLDSNALLASPILAPLAARMLVDARALAAACGVTLADDPSVLDPGRIPPHKTSMLQDMEKGRSLEFDAVFGAALDVAHWCGLEVPTLRLVAGLLAAKATRLGLLDRA